MNIVPIVVPIVVPQLYARIAQLVEHCTYEVNWPCKGLEFDSRYGHI